MRGACRDKEDNGLDMWRAPSCPPDADLEDILGPPPPGPENAPPGPPGGLDVAAGVAMYEEGYFGDPGACPDLDHVSPLPGPGNTFSGHPGGQDGAARAAEGKDDEWLARYLAEDAALDVKFYKILGRLDKSQPPGPRNTPPGTPGDLDGAARVADPPGARPEAAPPGPVAPAHAACYGLPQAATRGCNMPQLTISAAARAAGVDRSTLQRKIKSGAISTVLDEAGNRRIEVAELLRVFGPLKTDGTTPAAPHAVPSAAISQDAAPCGTPETAASGTLVEVLRRELEAAKDREAMLLNLLAKEQDARRELEQRMLPPGTGQAPRKGFWSRLFGRD